MKLIVLLLLASEPLYFPFDSTLGCHDQGIEIMEAIATYHGPGTKQGWYMDHGALIYGFYCE